mmetsp:Transcript_43468/g.109720  ORF Transcript_43468/g.109720 Transcript_43468/m.109720 type:complete len:260 (-) Transcript_43468:419-1198(-)
MSSISSWKCSTANSRVSAQSLSATPRNKKFPSARAMVGGMSNSSTNHSSKARSPPCRHARRTARSCAMTSASVILNRAQRNFTTGREPSRTAVNSARLLLARTSNSKRSHSSCTCSRFPAVHARARIFSRELPSMLDVTHILLHSVRTSVGLQRQREMRSESTTVSRGMCTTRGGCARGVSTACVHGPPTSHEQVHTCWYSSARTVSLSDPHPDTKSISYTSGSRDAVGCTSSARTACTMPLDPVRATNSALPPSDPAS